MKEIKARRRTLKNSQSCQKAALEEQRLEERRDICYLVTFSHQFFFSHLTLKLFYVLQETVVFHLLQENVEEVKGVKISLKNNTFILRFQLDSHLLNERRLWKNNAATRRNSKELPNSPFALLVNNY